MAEVRDEIATRIDGLVAQISRLPRGGSGAAVLDGAQGPHGQLLPHFPPQHPAASTTDEAGQRAPVRPLAPRPPTPRPAIRRPSEEESLGIARLSKSQVSVMTAELDEQVASSRTRPRALREQLPGAGPDS